MGKEQSHLSDAQGNWVWYDLIHFMISFPRRRKYFLYIKWETVFQNEQCCCCSVSQSCLTLWHHRLQHARLPYPSPSLRVCSNSGPVNRWCHPTISYSVIPFSACFQFFPASVSFPMSQLFASGGQSIGASVSASVFPMNIQGWFPLGFTDLRTCYPGDSQESSSAPQLKSINSSVLSLLYGPTLTSVLITSYYSRLWPLEKTIALTRWTFVGRVISLLFNTVSRFVIAFLPKSKRLLISWLQSPSTVILELKKIKSVTVSTFSCLFAMKWWTRCHDLSFFFFFFWIPPSGGL